MSKFCQQRGISTDGLNVVQNNENILEDDEYKKKITFEVTLPEEFPKKYHKAILAAAKSCKVKKVKKVKKAMPEFDIAIV